MAIPDLREVAGGGTSSRDAEYSPDSPDMDSSLEFDKSNTKSEKAHAIPDDFFARCAKFMARNAWMHFFAALLVSIALSAIGLTVGNFNVSVNNAGWQSRGTLIANRHQQVLMVLKHLAELSSGDSAYWTELEDNVQPGWESGEGDVSQRRLLVPPDCHEWIRRLEWKTPLTVTTSITYGDRTAPFAISESMARALQNSSGFEGCDVYSYFNTELDITKLWPMWKTKGSVSAHDPRGIRDICIAETNTQAVLEANDLCNKCSSGQCQPPYSLVLFARITVGDTDLELSCEDLANEWSQVVAETEKLMQDCVPDITLDYVKFGSLPDQCPSGFSPIMVDDLFGPTNNVIQYTSSIFQTVSDPKALYEIAGQFDRAAFSDVVYGAYDTADEAFNEFYVDVSVGNDMVLALGSAGVTAIAMLVHTRSIWISIVGLVQIILSFPLAYFVYTFIARLDFFPFLNFIGVFVLFALGSDDVFVAMDKWKNARIDNRHGSVEDIAAVALPDAAAAMFLTSITTSVAFFSTAISPVAPLKCFAVFCGLLIVFAYLLCVALVFPALCVYDRWLLRGPHFICSFHCFTKKGEAIDDFAPDDSHPSMIRRILSAFYVGFHKVRWLILAASVAATIVCAIFAAQLKQPTSSDVRLLSSSLMYEQAYEWRLHNLFTVIGKSGGAPGYVIWGVTPADTGNLANPASWTQLVLDETFDPSSTESQTYLLKFCDRFFAEDFAGYTEDGYVCGINSFDVWLKSESNRTDSSAPYIEHCEGATGLPMAVAAFNPCISAWASTTGDVSILVKDGVVKVIFIEFQQRIRFDSPYDQLNKEWNAIESWLTAERAAAPAGVNKMYHSSADFWWYDTNGNMLQAAYGSAAISLAFSAILVFFASRSLLLTLFCVLTIGFILTSTTALLVASGWTLGFLESICFAILIGISCDFVLHFSHAYAYLPGSVSRHERTKYALIRMGPSVLASAFTTICGAVLMIFCVISFFRKFAQILFYTILMATVGSFVVFLSLADSIGPTRPTYIYDKIAERCCGKAEGQQHDKGEYKAGETMSENKDVEVDVASVSYLPDDVSVEA